MSQFSFDIVSEFDKAEMNNVFDQVKREIANRYDFKGSSADINWLDSDKTGFKVTGDNQFHLDSIVEIVRKKLATRGQSQKVLDTSAEPVTTNLKMTWDIPFQRGLDQEKAKKITKSIRDELPKVKTQIQGEEVRVTSQKKDELQAVMQLIKSKDFDFPINFTNFR
ncbi:MAG TPA: YajQ family cyclic di-GMP-binding protein [Candidatus Saccharibacteria bacterium]|nr:YajQ family cyclic di-GMP-binding protein [Candidatus Saccharibacteria bacterium]